MTDASSIRPHVDMSQDLLSEPSATLIGGQLSLRWDQDLVISMLPTAMCVVHKPPTHPQRGKLEAPQTEGYIDKRCGLGLLISSP